MNFQEGGRALIFNICSLHLYSHAAALPIPFYPASNPQLACGGLTILLGRYSNVGGALNLRNIHSDAACSQDGCAEAAILSLPPALP